MKIWVRAGGWVAFGMVVQAALALENGSFDDGVRAWKAAWPVAAEDGAAALSDTRTRHVFLFQAQSAEPGPVAVVFDFRPGLSAEARDGVFLDSFYASLYEVDDLSAFITEHDRFQASHGLMDLDASGPFNVNGTVSASPRGAGWSRFSGTVTLSRRYAIVLFELYDLNFVAGDSEVRVDDVSMETAP